MSLGEKVSSVRRSRGMSQELLAEKAGISLRTIQRIEAGVTTPRLFTLNSLAASLNIPVEELSAISYPGESHETDKSALRLVNLSALSVILLPLIHIFIVLFVWKRVNSSSLIDSSGKKIISFQVIWTIAALVLVTLIPTIQQAVFHSRVIGKLPPTIFIVYGVMLLMNIILTLRTSRQLQRDEISVYPSIPTLF